MKTESSETESTEFFFFYYIMNGPIQSGNIVFREIQVVNGNIVKDVELVREIDSKNDVIEGHVNNIPIIVVRKLKKTKSVKKSNKKGSSKRLKKKSRATKSTKK